MVKPAGWLWGLVPLAVLWAAGNGMLGDSIERDVGRRATAAALAVGGEVPGARPVTVRVVGRDIDVSGETLSTDGAGAAMARLRSEFGVRRALGGLSQVVARKPYSWSAVRTAESVVISGFAPDEATAMANVAAAREALPGLRVDDRQSMAFGAPQGFAGITRAIVAELAKLSSGKVALDDQRFCIEGQAATPEQFLGLRQATAALAQGGFQAVDCALEPPRVAGFRWSAERGADGAVAVTGFYPSDAVRQQLMSLLRRSFPEPAAITDATLPALGASATFVPKVTRAIADLARLRSGKVEVDGDAYRLSGEGPADYESCEALRLLIAQTDGPDSVAQASISCPPAPPPPPPPPPPLPEMPALPEIPPLVLTDPSPLPPPPAPAPGPVVPLRWNATLEGGRLALSGLVRDDAARAELLALAQQLLPGAAIVDGLTLEPNLSQNPDPSASTRILLEALAGMTQGSVSIQGQQAQLSGAVSDTEALQRLTAALARGALPGGLDLGGGVTRVALRPYVLTASVDRTGVTLSGALPDEAARAALLAVVEASPLRDKLTDATRIVPGAPTGFVAAAREALTSLLRLDLGTARLSEQGLVLQGLTCRDLIKTEVETSIASRLPAGVAGRAEIGLRQTGCVIDPPNTCQADLDALTKRNTVLFAQGAYAVTLDPATDRVIGEVFTILKQCPDSRITIEGHTNDDGQRRGFDNLALSDRRAARVREELIGRGVDPAQLDARGYGPERPLSPHGTDEARIVNRRVQFTVAK